MFEIESMGVESLLVLLLNVSLKATLLAVTVWLALKLLRVRSVTVRHRVWTLVLGCMLVLPGIVFIAPEIGVPIAWFYDPSPIDAEVSRRPAALQESLPQPAIPEISASDVPPILDVSPVSSVPVIENTAISSLPVESPSAAPKDSMNPAPVRRTSPLFALGVLYILGVALLLTRIIVGLVHSRRLIHQAHPIDLPACEDGPPNFDRIMESDHVLVPLTLGLCRPVIILPADWHKWDASVVQVAVAHESEHVRRRDTWVSLATTLNAAVYWFHPLAWLLRWHITELSEQACDDEVIRTTGQRTVYAQVLVDMASRLASGAARYQPTVIGMAAKPIVEERVNRILDGGRPLATRVGWLSSFLLASMIATVTIITGGLSAVPVAIAAPNTDETEPASKQTPIEPAADEPAHLAMIVDNNELVLASIPNAMAADQSITTRSVKKNLRGARLRSIGVYGGHLIVLSGRTLKAFDLQSGVVRKLVRTSVYNAALAGQHLYFVSARPNLPDGTPSNALVHIDLSTMKKTELCLFERNTIPSNFGSSRDISIAVSPDGTHVAVTEFVKQKDEMQIQRPSVRIVVVSRLDGKVLRPQKLIPSRNYMTGGGDHTLAPKIAWTHDGVILIAAPKKVDDTGDFFDLHPSMELTTFDVATGKFERVCSLPIFNPRGHEPWFSYNANQNQSMIHLGSLGQYRVSLAAKKVIESSQLGSSYFLESANGQTALKFDDTILESNTVPGRVFLSKDGNRVAWLPTDLSQYPSNTILHRPTELKIHTPGHGIRMVMKGNFPRSWQRSQNPELNLCVWLTTEQLQRASSFDKLETIDNTPATPRVDTRPKIKTAMDVHISTDKKVYQRHEPLKMIIKLKNLSNQLVRFETKRLLHGGQPFDIDIKSTRARYRIELFDYDLNRPKDEYLNLPPGEVVTLTRTVEVKELGEQQLRLRFEHYNLWSGPFKVESEFEVLEQTTPELLKQKFDRLMAKCRRQYLNSEQHVIPSCFWQLGEDGGPLLIDFLRHCEDGVFRRSLGRGLAPLATAATLPYLRELLETDLEFEGELVTETLNRMSKLWTRANDETSIEARRLLFAAGRHSNPQVRQHVVENFTEVINDEVDQFMLQATDDPVAAIAKTAARYVAARRQLTLEQWFDVASRNVTSANLIAARSIAMDLKQVWKIKIEELPSGTVEEVEANTNKKQQYVATMKKWRQWCIDNPRTSNTFFDKTRGKAQRMQRIYKIWGDDDPPPIQISN